MTARSAIVDALGKVAAVQAYPAEPDQKHPGAAWPALRALTREGVLGGVYVRQYDVFAVLPPGYGPASADAAETLIEALVEALEPIGEWIQPAETVQIAFDNTTVLPGVRVRITPDPDC